MKGLVKNVAFFGYSEAKKGDGLYEDAYQVAAEVAKAGYVVVNGGGPGTMRATTEGAHSVGGTAIGITFYPNKQDMPLFEGADPENKVDELIETKNYLERTLSLLEHGDAYVIFNGGTGTISELGMAWGLARLHFGHHKPFVLFGEFWHPIVEEIAEHMRLREEEMKVFKIVSEAENVVPAIKLFEEEFKKVEHRHKGQSPFRI